MLNDKETDEKSNEPIVDNSMVGAFDFDVPEGNTDTDEEETDLGDDNSAQDDKKAGDDNSAEPEGDEDGSADQDDPTEGTIDPKLLVKIGRMGLSDDETDRVLELGSNKAISGVLELLENRKGASSGAGNSETANNGEEADWFGISDEAAEEFAPELIEVLQSMSGSTKKAVEQMFSKMSQEISQSNSYAFEDAVESLGKDWQPVFGKGENIDSKSEYGRNIEVLREVVFSDKYKGSVAKRVKAATKEMFSEHTNKIAKNEKVNKARNRQGRFIGRSAQRTMNDADLDPRKRGVANIERLMKEKGMLSEESGYFDQNDI